MLYIVSTPIGNLKDITQRALEVLRSSDIIVSESVSDTMRLLNAYDIRNKKILKYNDQNKKKAQRAIVSLCMEKNVAYVTSAGTPSISDPGADLVTAARDAGSVVNVVPGPSALVSAIAASGFRARQFTFVSFPPRKEGPLSRLFMEKSSDPDTLLVFFESPFRIVKTLRVMERSIPAARVCIAKEITKLFENYLMGTPTELLELFEKDKKMLKGEFTIVISFASRV